MWPFKSEEKTNEDWWRDVMKCEPWDYDPQPDITAYELALITKYVRGVRLPVWVPIDKGDAPYWDLIKRHFVRET